jgi:hypothetical protein
VAGRLKVESEGEVEKETRTKGGRVSIMYVSLVIKRLVVMGRDRAVQLLFLDERPLS